MFNMEVTINPSFYIKTNKDVYHDSITSALGWIMQDAEAQCMLECPVVTGNLQRSHYTEVDDTVGRVLNSADYASDVIYGTNQRPPNDYPQRALNNLNGSYDEKYIQELEKSGVFSL